MASDYLDGSLSLNKSQRIQAHLAWCRPCQAFLASLEATVLLLRGLPKEKAPEHLRQRVGARGSD